MEIELATHPKAYKGNIKVFGIGGAGSNILSHIVNKSKSSFYPLAINTDCNDLNNKKLPNIFNIGAEITSGLGAGSDPKIGLESAKESKQLIVDALENTDILFCLAGMGGGTGTGATPFIVETAREMDILTISAVTLPFDSEGKIRLENANQGIIKMKEASDVLIIFPNQKILERFENLSVFDAFSKANNTFLDIIDSICLTMNETGYINVDFADIKRVIKDKGHAIICSGTGRGENRIGDAFDEIFENVITTNMNLKSCGSVIINVIGGNDLQMNEFEQATAIVADRINADVDIIKGLVMEQSLSGVIKIILIATGLNLTDKFAQTKEKENSDKNMNFVHKEIKSLPEEQPINIRRIKNIQSAKNNYLPSFLSKPNSKND